jgi:hypothetical protein
MLVYISQKPDPDTDPAFIFVKPEKNGQNFSFRISIFVISDVNFTVYVAIKKI